ncbi:DNA modification methylase [Roseovarius pacificus]|uniref:Methyltransferase n=1 Tax=Roseovarius pacificus TaxID=337701 RepID=A0A1M6X8K5_9RHOB|nr:DNA methyltransferase [Roseovarius pacificus]GGO52431.1 methyltransferase [Roseovarius pacificus]SHL02307.1 DNA modification methylase [Roseovarius pacificus]
MAEGIEDQRDLAVCYRPLTDLKPDPRNARTHPKRQIDQLQASMREFGFTNPILADPEGGIIAGHGRLIAARALGMTEVPVIELSGLTDAQKRALRLADNKIALNAGWDLEILQLELAELSAIDVDIDPTLTGFSTGEIDVIVDGPDDPEDEVVPAVPVTPRARPGDIWVLGEHRIGCGDSRDTAFLERVVGKGAQIDAAFLDPPYNVRISGHANAKGRHREFAMASGEMDDDEFRAFLEATLGAAAQVSREGAVHFVCMDWRHMDDVAAVGRKVYGARLNLCVWNKSNAGMGSLYRSKHELVFVYRVGDASHLNMVELGKHGRNRTNVWDYASVNSMKGSRREDLVLHPTVKPTGLVADALRDVTRHGDLVLDTFLGSGTTLIAAERIGRRFRGIDIDPAYVDVAIERWSALTGREPELETAP